MSVLCRCALINFECRCDLYIGTCAQNWIHHFHVPFMIQHNVLNSMSERKTEKNWKLERKITWGKSVRSICSFNSKKITLRWNKVLRKWQTQRVTLLNLLLNVKRWWRKINLFSAHFSFHIDATLGRIQDYCFSISTSFSSISSAFLWIFERLTEVKMHTLPF